MDDCYAQQDKGLDIICDSWVENTYLFSEVLFADSKLTSIIKVLQRYRMINYVGELSEGTKWKDTFTYITILW